MKKNYTTIFTLLFVALSFAQVTLTQTTDTILTIPNSVMCVNSGSPTENFFYRSFDIASMGYSEFEVTRVDFGVESLIEGDAPYSVEVKIYSLSGGSFPAGTLTELASQDVPLTNADSGIIKEVTLTTPVTVSSAELVVAIHVLNGVDQAVTFFIGSNSNGQTAPGYIASVPCSVANPTNIASIGFPDMHLILDVTGNPTLSTDNSNLAKGRYKLYPNPVNDKLFLELLDTNTVNNVSVTNAVGQSLDLEYKNGVINTSNLSSGIYVILVETQNGTIVEKIVRK